MNIGAAIRSILISNTEINNQLTQVSPLVMGQTIELPYCIYEIAGQTPSKILGGPAKLHTVALDITVFGKTYTEVHTALYNIRAVLDGYCGADEAAGVQIYNIEYEDSRDAFNQQALIYGHTITFNLKLKATTYAAPTWVLESGKWVGVNGRWLSTGLWNSGT